MKKIILSLFVIAAVTVLTNKATAQYAIPSYDVPVVADPTTFEETSRSSSYSISPFTKINVLSIQPVGKGERKLIVTVKDSNINTTAWVIINIYSLDGSITYGPYTVTEGIDFEKYLSTDYEWGVSTIDASVGSEMDVFFE